MTDGIDHSVGIYFYIMRVHRFTFEFAVFSSTRSYGLRTSQRFFCHIGTFLGVNQFAFLHSYDHLAYTDIRFFLYNCQLYPLGFAYRYINLSLYDSGVQLSYHAEPSPHHICTFGTLQALFVCWWELTG